MMDRFILCVATVLLIVAVWIALSVDDSRQVSAIKKEIAELKLLLNEEKDRKVAFEKEIADLKLLLNEEKDRKVAFEKEIADLKLLLNEEKDRKVAFEKEIADLKLLLNKEKDRRVAFEKEMADITKGTNVAFYARLSESNVNIVPWATIVFSSIETNEGNAYNSVNGEFTAPIAGTYVFYSHILSWPGRFVETCLQINNNSKMFLYSGSGAFHGSGSNMAIVHLNVDDKVKMVKHGPWGTKPLYIHQNWSSFSGFLLRADANVL